MVEGLDEDLELAIAVEVADRRRRRRPVAVAIVAGVRQGEVVQDSALGRMDDEAAGAGGSSAGAFAGAMGAGLVAMVAGLTIGKKKYAEVEAEMQSILERAGELRDELTTAVVQDSAAFEQVMSAFRMPKDALEQAEARSAAIEAATLEATQVPLRVANLAVEVLRLAARAVGAGNINTICDAGSGAALAEAALAGASLNVQVNLANLKDREIAEQLIDEIRQLEKKARELTKEIENTLAMRGGLSAG